MTEIASEKPENGIFFHFTLILSHFVVFNFNFFFIETNGRTRFSLKPHTTLLRDSDDSDAAAGIYDSEESEEDSESEDEWTESSAKKRKKKSQSIKVPPAQTLKKKLAEKTKALRKNAIKTNKPAEPVESSKPVEEFQIKPEIHVVRQFKVEIANEVKVEKPDPKVKIESTVSTEAEAMIKPSELSANIIIKKTETVSEVEKPKKNEPVVLTYSMVKDSSNISPYLLAGTSIPTSFDLNASPVASSSPVPVATSPSLTSSPCVTSTTSPTLPNTNLTPPAPSPPVPRIRIRSNLASQAFRNSLTNPCRPLMSPMIPAGPRPRMRAPTPRTPRARAPRPRMPYQRSPVSPALTNSLGRPRKPSPIPSAHSRPFGGLPSPTVSPRTPTNVQRTPTNVQRTPTNVQRTPANIQRTPTLKDSTSLKNISPSGAVIYSGSNSVTITPRKVVPERPTVQRKLFKNEIEGVIAVRHEYGVLKYVVNLANGTHMPLTEHQVAKLREQNGGRLPTKLKIPVPSDVAAKIEPSYLIED